MSNELATTNVMDASAIESVLIGGDLSRLSNAQRVNYYQSVCKSIGLNPLTKPFDYIQLNGKLTLYAKKDAADQLRKIHGVSIDDVDVQEVGDTFVVKVKGHDNSGRGDVEIGVVKKNDMRGDVANAQMKAVTKAKRRLTLSLCGLGWLDETEIESIPTAKQVVVKETGEILDENINQETGEAAEAVELIDPTGAWAVEYAAQRWNISKADAAKAIYSKHLGKRMDKRDFINVIDGGE